MISSYFVIVTIVQSLRLYSIRGTEFPLLIEAPVLMPSWWIKYQNCNNKDTKTADILSLDNIHMYIKKKSNKAYILTNFSGRTEKYTCIILYQIDRIQFLTVWPQNCHPLPVPMQLLQSGTSSQPRTNGSGA